MNSVKITFLVTSLCMFSLSAMDNSLTTQKGLNDYLGVAAQMGNLEEVKLLIIAGADPIAPSSESGTTPLTKAAYEGHLPVVKHLVELKATINEIDKSLGQTPFHLAIQQGHYPVVEYLAFNGASLTLPNRTGREPITIARQYANRKIENFLIQLSIDLSRNNIIDSAKSNNNAHVQMLLEQSPESVNTQDYTGRTPLAWAVKNKNYKLVQLLLNAGADQSIADQDNITPLTIAFNLNDEELANLLLG